jgi:uncharacterized protein (TIGR03083 family)
VQSADAVGAQLSDLADCLTDLTLEQWNEPSLCAEWRNRDVLAHVIAGAEGAFGVRAVLRATLRYGLNFDRWVAEDGRARGRQDPSTLLISLREAARATAASPPTRAPIRALAHVVIHGQDICRPLEIDRDLSEAHLVPIAEFVATSIIFRVRTRIAGLRLVAEDADWSLGSGPEVMGPIEALIMTMAGRTAAINDLSGDGVAALRQAFANRR